MYEAILGYFVVLARNCLTHVGLHCNANEKTNHEKGYWSELVQMTPDTVGLFIHQGARSRNRPIWIY